MKTPEIQQELGAVILDAFPHIGVDVHEPEVTVRLEIRDNGSLPQRTELSPAQEECRSEAPARACSCSPAA